MTETITVRTCDLETTDFPPEGQVIELGYYDLTLQKEDEGPWRMLEMGTASKQQFFMPERPISIEARSTHHIRDAELEGAPAHTELRSYIYDENVSVYVAHNADFEMQYIKIPEASFWVDTLKVATRGLPDAKKHNNQYLKYFLGIDLPDELCMPPHRALPDSVVTAHIFANMLEKGIATLREMIQWSREPLYLTKLTFGKHFGKRYDEVPRDYLDWLLRQADMDPGVHAACRRVINGG